MAAGLVAHYDEMELSVSATFTESFTGVNKDTVVSAGIKTRHGLTYLSPTTIGILLSVEGYNNRTGGPTPTGHAYRFQVPDAGISQAQTAATFLTGMACSVVLSDVKLYATAGGGWRLDFSWEFIVEGASHSSGGPVTMTGDWLCPVGTPLLGTPPELLCSASIDPPPVVAVPGVFSAALDYTAEVTAEVEGGWRWKYAGSGAWQAPPVSLAPVLPQSSCSITAPVPSYSATTTWDGATSATHASSYTGSAAQARATYSQAQVSLFLMPHFARDIVRIGDTYAALWYRAAIPYTRSSQVTDCWDIDPGTDPWDDPGSGSQSSSQVERSQHWSEFLEEVGKGTATIEAPFSDTLYATARVSSLAFDALNKPTNSLGRYYKRATYAASYPYSSEDPDTSGLVAYVQPVFGEEEPDIVSFCNQVAAPHWLLFFWFPAQSGAGYQWNVDGSPELPEDYWLPWRGQWLSHPSLPGGGSRKRCNIIAEGLYHSALSPFVASRYFGNCETGWVGSRRFWRVPLSPPASYEYTSASSSLWSGTNCSLAFGAADVVATATAAGACEVDLLLHSFTVEPYLFPQTTKGAVLDWILGGGATNGGAYLVSVDGSEVLYTSTASASEVLRPLGDDAKYVGSWRQDFGQGSVTDQGSDDLVAGDSNTAFYGSDPTRAQHYMLLAGRGAKYIRFKFTAASGGDTMTVRYPILFAP